MQLIKKFRNDALEGSVRRMGGKFSQATTFKDSQYHSHRSFTPPQVLVVVVLVVLVVLTVLILLVPLLAVTVLLLVIIVPLLVAAVPLLCIILLLLIPLTSLIVWKRSSMPLITMGT
jgi:hypothetical protein